MPKKDKTQCHVCNKKLSKYFLNNKKVCLTCDDLLFDIEIEIDPTEETEKRPSLVTPTVQEVKLLH